jgi:hypothetical protein
VTSAAETVIADADRYLLATFYQENLKFVRPDQPVEVSLDLYPGQIFAGKVHSIWARSAALACARLMSLSIMRRTLPQTSTSQVAAVSRVTRVIVLAMPDGLAPAPVCVRTGL